ncbi:hypothetical protein GBA65_03075 [Rubrobacter marinus]|uniref:OmpR/PhoB-type domain-containing protein n=1 Tax=Rubrobacter marinus TaxID=2653852 RepID=A0A6G8PTY6_9ACTN|nr:BTAD domain-containing putative transcriptional regulator [Rubrobacter marinus]QIN77657.1 hypothetical protein GBA65_03075 [Rubrobacter marinus]
MVEQGQRSPGERYRPLDADFVRRILDAAQQGENRLSFCSVAWELGQDLVARGEYGLADVCFDRLSSFAGGVEDHFLVEAARAAKLLSSALGGGQTPGEDLREVVETLRQDLTRLTPEDVRWATATLASPAGSGAPPNAARLPRVPAAHPGARSAFRPAPGPGSRPAADYRAGDRRKIPARLDTPGRVEFEVRFLGRFELLRQGRALDLGRSGKARTILKYLLARSPRPVSRDCLIEWLWPESGARRARWSLNAAMSSVRKILSEGGRARELEGLVVCEAGYYRLSPNARISSDVHEFEARCRNGRLLEESGRASEAVEEYERAVELYRDDYMIEDLYEDWTLIERERLADTHMDVLDRLARHYAETGQAREAIRACYRALERDPCRESTYRILMQCYARLGLRHRALQQYRMTEELLGSRYGTSPSPQTRALYRSLLRGLNI